MQDNLEFYNEIPDDLKCGICLQLMVQPRILSCNHGFCFKCINNKSCNQCDSNILLEDLIKSSEAENRIKSLKVKCSFMGCNEKICIKDLKEHQGSCKFASKNGIFTEFGCKEMLNTYDSANHTIDEMESHSTSIISMVKELNEKNQNFETKLEAAMEQIQSLKINEANLMSSVSQLDISHKQVLEGLQILVNDQYSKISEIENLKKEKSTFDTNMMYVMNQKEELEKKLKTLERSNQLLRANLKELTNGNIISEKLDECVKVENEEVTKLTQENEKLKEMLKELRKENKELQDKFIQLETVDNSNSRPSLSGNSGSENVNSILQTNELNQPMKFELKFANPMIWPINNMKTLISQKTLWSYSFYINGGYKVQMGLQILETECKLKFRIMKGENDNYLEWPCRKNITISIISKRTSKDPLLSAVFSIENGELDSRQFKKPKKKSNKEMFLSQPINLRYLVIDPTNTNTNLSAKCQTSNSEINMDL